MKILKSLTLLLSLSLLFSCNEDANQEELKQKKEKEKIIQSSSIPSINFSSDCLEPNAKEIELISSAAKTLNLAIESNNLVLKIGTEKFFAKGLYRNTKEEKGEICISSKLFQDFEILYAEHNSLLGKLQEYQLDFLAKVPKLSNYSLDKLAILAFSKNKDIYTESTYLEYEKIDLRPKARMILALNGNSIQRYSEYAYAELSGNDSLGTSAAQMSAALNYKDSLVKIEKILDSILQVDGPISFREYARFKELAYAILLSGETAKNHAKPIKEILNRQVQSAAPPFGTINLSPKTMCFILLKIHNDDISVIKEHEFCMDNSYPNAKIPSFLTN